MQYTVTSIPARLRSNFTYFVLVAEQAGLWGGPYDNSNCIGWFSSFPVMDFVCLRFLFNTMQHKQFHLAGIFQMLMVQNVFQV